MNKQPAITVFMPVYNAEKYLKEAIDSILNQTFQNFELLIIDDGSTDESVKIIEGYTCLLYTSPSPRDRQKSRMPSSA